MRRAGGAAEEGMHSMQQVLLLMPLVAASAAPSRAAQQAQCTVRAWCSKAHMMYICGSAWQGCAAQGCTAFSQPAGTCSSTSSGYQALESLPTPTPPTLTANSTLMVPMTLLCCVNTARWRSIME